MITNISSVTNTYTASELPNVKPPEQPEPQKPEPEKEKQGNYDRVDLSAESIKEQVKQAREQAEAQGKALAVIGKCLRIAMHIIAGDNVPRADDKFLFENNPKLHGQAWLMRQIKQDPEECESVLDEDDVNGEEESAGSETAVAEAAEIPEAAAPTPEAAASVSEAAV